MFGLLGYLIFDIVHGLLGSASLIHEVGMLLFVMIPRVLLEVLLELVISDTLYLEYILTGFHLVTIELSHVLLECSFFHIFGKF